VFIPSGLDEELVKAVDTMVGRSESNKGIVTVLTTLLTHKIVEPEQDIRYHQAGMEGGFAGRGIDQTYVTPFMKSVSFPSMAESGWLTRSLEQPMPYTLDYGGKITPVTVKTAFLSLIDCVQTHGFSAERILLYFFICLVKKRDSMNVELAKPHSLSIAAIVSLMEKHFTLRYTASGAARLPVLAIYAAYQCMVNQALRFEDKVLCDLASHNSADIQSGRIGDVDINYTDGSAFEGVEIKHGIIITRQHITDAYEKFKVYNTERYYLLTTANMDNADLTGINEELQRIAGIHGCQVIVNGVYATLNYYLRLLKNPAEFVEKYVDLLKIDETIKFQHKTAWNDAVSGMV
jgi:DNA (cytosine-5)-methyltransferase 1